ncbi:MAG: hypothetical protein ACR2PS_14485, partial [Pseudomonadales bacterium]
VAMHAAINEVGALFATATVHSGWDNVSNDGIIRYKPDMLGGHAFAIVGYASPGFWLQNSCGTRWGYNGFAHLAYSDWLENGMDVWVARLGVPMRVSDSSLSTGGKRGIETARFSLNEVRRHVISIGNDGLLQSKGQFGTDEQDISDIFNYHIPAATAGWTKPRILLYAHGGLVDEDSALESIDNNLLQLLDHEIYPIAFVWKTDFWTTIANILKDAVSRRKAEGKILDAAKDFLLDRLDDALEPLAMTLGGKALWQEMKENALRSSTLKAGGARITTEYLAGYLENTPTPVHLVCHSAGSVFLGPLAQLLANKGKIQSGPMRGFTGFGIPVHTAHLWAPACTMRFFEQTYLPLIESKALKAFHLYTLTDKAEKDDDCKKIYNKSLLYLVSNAFEDKYRVPIISPDGEPLLGMQKFIDSHPALKKLISKNSVNHILSPNTKDNAPCDAASAAHHGDFDNDTAVRPSTLNDILDRCNIAATELSFESASAMASQRVDLINALEK